MSKSDSPSVMHTPADCYTVRNGWSWAHIFVRNGTARGIDDQTRYWVHLSIISDYGSFGYCWSHIGEDWRAFLSNLDMHYAMKKMLGASFYVPLLIHEAEAKGRALILRDRRDGCLAADEARELWGALDRAERDYDLTTFLRDWDHHSGGLWYRHDYWGCSWDKVNPQAEGFWQEIWPHFIAALSEEE